MILFILHVINAIRKYCEKFKSKHGGLHRNLKLERKGIQKKKILKNSLAWAGFSPLGTG